MKDTKWTTLVCMDCKDILLQAQLATNATPPPRSGGSTPPEVRRGNAAATAAQQSKFVSVGPERRDLRVRDLERQLQAANEEVRALRKKLEES